MRRYHVAPNPGGKLNQPARFVEACDIIDTEIEAQKAIVAAREKAKADVKALVAQMKRGR